MLTWRPGVHVQQVPRGSESTLLVLEVELLVPSRGGSGTLRASIPQLDQPEVVRTASFTSGSAGRQYINLEVCAAQLVNAIFALPEVYSFLGFLFEAFHTSCLLHLL